VDHDEIDKNLNTLFKLVHVTSFNVSIQALMLLNQVMDSRDDMIHRYYNALYKRMFDLEWRNTAKQTYFLNLLYNSVIKDEAIPRIKVSKVLYFYIKMRHALMRRIFEFNF
jgi:ribosome biogenesis protein MAK21